MYLASRHTLVRHRELLPTRYMGHTIRTPTFRYTEWRSFTPATYTTDWSGQAVAREPKPFVLEFDSRGRCFILYWNSALFRLLIGVFIRFFS